MHEGGARWNQTANYSSFELDLFPFHAWVGVWPMLVPAAIPERLVHFYSPKLEQREPYERRCVTEEIRNCAIIEEFAKNWAKERKSGRQFPLAIDVIMSTCKDGCKRTQHTGGIISCGIHAPQIAGRVYQCVNNDPIRLTHNLLWQFHLWKR